jgi:glycosyltransferase involved in cell wall biosynthesis
MPDSRVIAITSTMTGDPWGGSEELWSRTALELVLPGHRVWAAICGWRPLDRPLAFFEKGPMRHDIEGRVSMYGLDDRVTPGGASDGVEALQADRHMLVQPSRHQEGSPLTVVEAMTCARPVLATDVADHDEVVEDGVTGFLAESATVPSIGWALDCAWRRRGDLRTRGMAGARRIRPPMPHDAASVFDDDVLRLC